MPQYEIGQSARHAIVVGPGHLSADTLVPGLLTRGGEALSTTTLHLACEMACHLILVERFDDDDASVGIHNDIWFWGDAAPGELLHAEAVIAVIDGRRILFNVFARAGIREIARGIHERMLVSHAGFMAGLTAPPAGA